MHLPARHDCKRAHTHTHMDVHAHTHIHTKSRGHNRCRAQSLHRQGAPSSQHRQAQSQITIQAAQQAQTNTTIKAAQAGPITNTHQASALRQNRGSLHTLPVPDSLKRFRRLRLSGPGHVVHSVAHHQARSTGIRRRSSKFKQQ